MLLEVKLNVPPFLCGKEQFSENELVLTRRTVLLPLCINVKHAMEQI